MRKKTKIVGIPALDRCKVGFFINGRVHVSPAVAKLAESDIKLLLKFRVFRAKEGRYGSLREFVEDVSSRHEIFGGQDEALAG